MKKKILKIEFDFSDDYIPKYFPSVRDVNDAKFDPSFYLVILIQSYILRINQDKLLDMV